MKGGHVTDPRRCRKMPPPPGKEPVDTRQCFELLRPALPLCGEHASRPFDRGEHGACDLAARSRILCLLNILIGGEAQAFEKFIETAILAPCDGLTKFA